MKHQVAVDPESVITGTITVSVNRSIGAWIRRTGSSGTRWIRLGPSLHWSSTGDILPVRAGPSLDTRNIFAGGLSVHDTQEQVVLVDAEDREIGVGAKDHVHRCGSLHRAFSIFVFDGRGNLLLQRRANSKYHSAGLWSNTCCGHPRPGESTRTAPHRRLREEMGFDCDLVDIFSFIYRAELENGIVEHEYDHVFLGEYDGTPSVDPMEVAEWKFVPMSTLIPDIGARPDDYTYWLKAILRSSAKNVGRRLKTRAA